MRSASKIAKYSRTIRNIKKCIHEFDFKIILKKIMQIEVKKKIIHTKQKMRHYKYLRHHQLAIHDQRFKLKVLTDNQYIYNLMKDFR